MSDYRRFSKRLASTSTRGGFLSRSAKWALGVTGVTVASTALSVLNPHQALAQPAECDKEVWCGLCGKPCSLCGGTISSCPSGSTQGTGLGWTRCCFFSITGWFNVRYDDCCGGGTCSDSNKCFNAANCSPGGPTWPVWCSGGYRCTVAIITSSC